MKKNLIAVYLLFWCQQAIVAQSSNDAVIQWGEGIGWEAIKEKAKEENKYIFLDFVATWCGPCKKMDASTYKDERIIQLLNSQFIPVKIQMDQTDKDPDAIRKWYADAAKLGKQFRVKAYPTLVFLSPEGKLVEKSSGMRNAEQFAKLAANALKPGKTFIDRDSAFYVLNEEYQSGAKNYANMPLLFIEALSAKENEIAWTVSKEYREYLLSKPKKEWYSKNTITFLASHSIGTESPFFTFFYKSNKKVNRIMGEQGYAENMVVAALLREFAVPLIDLTIGPRMMRGGKRDTTEADWMGLYSAVKKNYGRRYAERVVLDAKLYWYDSHFNTPLLLPTLFTALEKYGFNSQDKNNVRSYSRVNSILWGLVQSTDTVMLREGLRYGAMLADQATDDPWFHNYIDTYANMLYKTGEVDAAIRMQEKALSVIQKKVAEQNYAPGFLTSIEHTLNQMRQGIPTWPIPKKKS